MVKRQFKSVYLFVTKMCMIMQSYVHGLRGVFIGLTCLAGLGLVTTFFVPQASMDQALESDHQLELLRIESNPPSPSLGDSRNPSSLTIHTIYAKEDHPVELRRVV